MEKNTTPTPKEEVDLGKLFEIIGNGFKKLFNGIGNLFKNIFHYFILLLIFFKKHAIILGVATLIGCTIGFFMDFNKPTYYKSEMIMKMNYGSAKRIYNQKKYIETLVKNEDSVALANYFKIKTTEASQLLGFEVEPYEKSKNVLIDFDYFLERRDTNYVKKFDLKDYSRRISDTELRFQKITFYALNDSIFKKLSNGFVQGVENDHYNKLKDVSVARLKLKRTRLERDLSEIDSLRNSYQKISLLEAKSNNSGGTNVNLSTKSLYRNNNDISLFNSSTKILLALENLKFEEERSGKIATVVSDFNIGNEIDSLMYKKWVRYGMLGFILMTLFILGKKVNLYLSNYKS